MFIKTNCEYILMKVSEFEGGNLYLVTVANYKVEINGESRSPRFALKERFLLQDASSDELQEFVDSIKDKYSHIYYQRFEIKDLVSGGVQIIKEDDGKTEEVIIN